MRAPFGRPHLCHRASATLVVLLAAPSLAAQSRGPASLQLAVGISAVVDHDAPITRISIGDLEVADAVVVSDSEIVVTGRALGMTTLVTWDEAGGRSVIDVAVSANTALLEAQLASLFDVDDVRVSAAGSALVVEGAVADAATAARVVEFLRAVAVEGAMVLDQLEVADPGQVLLRVRFAEVSRSALKETGIRLLRVDPDDLRGDDEVAVGAAGALRGSFLGEDGPDVTFSDAIDLFVFHRASHVAAFIRALQREGVFRSLAEPNLITMSGERASFLAGGEFPYPVLQGGAAAGGVTVEFKEFGVRLGFTPTFVSSERIRLEVAPEVSSLDFGNALELSGLRIPVVLTRRAETVVELAEGHTFAIAGLMESSLAESADRVPFLADIPVLGRLFRSEEARRNETELLVLVTPEIVRPAAVPPELPGDDPPPPPGP